MTSIEAIDLEVEKKNRTISGVSTTVFFILLALLLWLVTFEKPKKEEIPEVFEIPVTLDESPSGGGEGAPAENVPVDVSPNVPQMSLPSATEQTNDVAAVNVKKSTNVVNPKADPTIDEDQKLLNDMLNKKKGQVAGKGGEGNDPFGTGKGTGEGDGTGPGSGPGPGGTGTGGASHNLNGRRLFNTKKVSNDCNATGKVVFDVVVQPDGTISNIEPDPGFDDNSCLVSKGRAILRNANFDKSTTNKIVTGKITIHFKLE